MSKLSARTTAMALVASFTLAACGGEAGGDENLAADTANHIAEDPFGATGAPGADLTDNGVTDGASGLADTNNSTDAGNAAANAADPAANGAASLIDGNVQ